MSAHSLERTQHLLALINSYFPPPWSADLNLALSFSFGFPSVPRFHRNSHGDFCGFCWADVQRNHAEKITWTMVTEARVRVGHQLQGLFAPCDTHQKEAMHCLWNTLCAQEYEPGSASVQSPFPPKLQFLNLLSLYSPL